MNQKKWIQRLLSLVLVVALFISAVPAQAFAVEKTEIVIPEIEIGSDILDHDVFYLATASASIPENGNGAYLLRVGRGGSADSESTALIKIADMTAKYGEDYIVRVHGGVSQCGLCFCYNILDYFDILFKLIVIL